MLGFNVPQKISNSIFFKNWPKTSVDVEDDPHEAPILAYSREMNHLVEVITINSEVEEEDYETCPNGEMTKLDDEEKNIVLETPCPKDLMTNEEEGMEPTTLRIKMGYNDMQVTHWEKLGLLSMSNIKTNDTVDI
jgi:hypothetical protein